MAQKALKFNKDMTFSLDETDMLLPIRLRKNKGMKGPVVSQALRTAVAFRREFYVPNHMQRLPARRLRPLRARKRT